MSNIITVEDRAEFETRWDDLRFDFRQELDELRLTGIERDKLLDRIGDFKKLFDRANSSYKT